MAVKTKASLGSNLSNRAIRLAEEAKRFSGMATNLRSGDSKSKSESKSQFNCSSVGGKHEGVPRPLTEALDRPRPGRPRRKEKIILGKAKTKAQAKRMRLDYINYFLNVT